MVKLVGLAPIFSHEARAIARRWQAYAVRSLFLAGMLAALAFGFWVEEQQKPVRRVTTHAGFWFFSAISLMQLALVLLVAPAATAGAVCLDRARGALSHALLTDLTNAEIVLGKLLARLVPVLGLMACGLPVMVLAAFLGGVDPDAFLAGTLLAAATAVLGCSLGLAFSVWANRTDEALLATYAVLVAWIAACPAWMFFNRIGWLLYGPPGWLTGSNPILLIATQLWNPGRVGWLDVGLLVTAMLVVSAVVTAVAIATLRAAAAQSWNRPGRRSPARCRVRLLSPSLDGNPVLWREWRRRRATGWVGLLWVLYDLCAIAATATIIALVISRGLNVSTRIASLLNGLQVAAGMLLLAVRSTTTFAEERARGGLDVLLSTPLQSRSIVLAKWWGAFSTVPRLAFLPVVAVAAVACRSGRFEALLLIAGVVLSYGAALASLGLALATWFSRAGWAATLGVAAHVMVTVGWFFLVVIATQGTAGRIMWTGLASASPFLAATFVTNGMQDMSLTDWHEFIAWLIFWMVIDLAAAFLLLMATLASFDRCLGRIAFRRARGARTPRSTARGVVPCQT
jgi:ABC-type transport system involved in multi-copper enzyme maturation permease subunit